MIITSARNRPKMSGSKNTELTVKYVCRSLATTSRGLRMIVLVAYSAKPEQREQDRQHDHELGADPHQPRVQSRLRRR